MRPVARMDGVPEDAQLLESGLGTTIAWAALDRRGLIDRAWRALFAAILLPLAAHSALAEDDDEDGDDEDDDEDGDDAGGAGGGSDGSGTGTGGGF